MKRINEGTVELTRSEQEIKEVFDGALGEGFTVEQAAWYALSALPKPQKPFVEYLSEGILTVEDGRVSRSVTETA